MNKLKTFGHLWPGSGPLIPSSGGRWTLQLFGYEIESNSDDGRA